MNVFVEKKTAMEYVSMKFLLFTYVDNNYFNNYLTL